MFIDQIHISVQAGNGGNGCDSYFRRRDKKVIAHGGDGGNGGRVIFRSDTNAPPLSDLRYKRNLIAEAGGHGGSNRKRGKNGKDLIVLLPPGTRIFDRGRQLMIRELNKTGEEVVVLEGGRGGAGNAGGKEATPGETGATLELDLSIRIQADVFLVGLPNSGKSKVLNTWTRAHAKEESYPFATKSPRIGVWNIDDVEEPITVCEIPSIYGASHEGRGAGMEAVKHLEKAKWILYFLDPVSKFASSLGEGYRVLRDEIGDFCKDYLKIPHAVVVNKMDLPEAREKVAHEAFQPGVRVFHISALTGEGMEPLRQFLLEEVRRCGTS